MFSICVAALLVDCMVWFLIWFSDLLITECGWIGLHGWFTDFMVVYFGAFAVFGLRVCADVGYLSV